MKRNHKKVDGTKQTGCSCVAALALPTLQPQGALCCCSDDPPSLWASPITSSTLRFPLRVMNGLTPVVWACPTSRVENGNAGHLPHLPRLAVGDSCCLGRDYRCSRQLTNGQHSLHLFPGMLVFSSLGTDSDAQHSETFPVWYFVCNSGKLIPPGEEKLLTVQPGVLRSSFPYLGLAEK